RQRPRDWRHRRDGALPAASGGAAHRRQVRPLGVPGMGTRSYSIDAESGSDGSADTGSSDANGDSELMFDGFTVMFVEKVMLTPVAPAMQPAPLTRAQSRRWH